VIEVNCRKVKLMPALQAIAYQRKIMFFDLDGHSLSDEIINKMNNSQNIGM
jgi:L-serine deaminase